MNTKPCASVLFWTVVFSVGLSSNLHGRVPVTELLTQVAPSGSIWTRREVLSELRAVKLRDGTLATTVLLGDTRWKSINGEPQQVQRIGGGDPNAKPSTDAEILENLSRNHTKLYEHSQLWFVDLLVYPEVDAKLKAVLITEEHPSSYEREIGFVGCVDQWAIYAYTPIWSWVYMQQRLKAVGGDDPLAGAVRGLRAKDNGTAASCQDILAKGGAKAVPYLRNLIATSPPDPIVWSACTALALTKTAEAGALLTVYAKSSSPALASSARRLMIFYRLPEGNDLYFAWMDQDAGTTDVRELLEACAAVDKRRLAPFLPRILKKPRTIFEYRRAFDLARELSSNPIPFALLDAERALGSFSSSDSPTADREKLERVIDTIISSPDIEAAAHIGLSFSLRITKGPPPWGGAVQRILKELPPETVKSVAAPLLASCDLDWVQSSLKNVLSDIR